MPYALSGWLGGFLKDPSETTVTVEFLAADQSGLGTGQIGPVTALDRWLSTKLLKRDTSGTIPAGTRSAVVLVTFKDCNPEAGNYNDAYADNLAFTVGAPLPAPPPPTPPGSTVRPLDHVFMIYFENHGVTDIIGSRNAPYINSLINTYGYGSNYFALTHPSDPNYYPILGGSDFGTNFNCPANCFDQPNLADNVEAAFKTWAGYAEDARPMYPHVRGWLRDRRITVSRLPQHLLQHRPMPGTRAAGLTQMATDLASTATTPNFVWWAAD